MRLPNLIIAGVPKAGSSSLFYWLSAHPEVYGAPDKETFYFIDRDSSVFNPEANFQLHGLSLYESFFPNCPEDAKIVLEATPHYIYQQTALDFFANCQEQPHVVFLLRKPSKRLFSSFSFVQNYLTKIDSDLTFEQATNLLLDDTGTLIEKLDYPSDSFIYKWLEDQLPNNCYYNFISLWAERFPPDKIHIILFEEMVSNPQKTMTDLAKKLDIDSNFYQNFYFEKRTKTVTIKNRFTHQLLIKLAPYLGTSKLRALLKSLYFRLNSSPPKPANSESLERLEEYFQPYNQKLAEKFDLNLEPWN